MLSWLPYTLASMYSVFINKPPLSPELATVPALCAKSSLIWPAFLNIILLKIDQKNALKDENASNMPLLPFTTRTQKSFQKNKFFKK
jgi:hypothetical protein